jgi:hypothetical protein
LPTDGGVMLLRDVERRVALAKLLAICLKDPRDFTRIDHSLVAMLRLRMSVIAASYEDADDCDVIRCSSWPWDGSRRAGVHSFASDPVAA